MSPPRCAYPDCDRSYRNQDRLFRLYCDGHLVWLCADHHPKAQRYPADRALTRREADRDEQNQLGR
jgi:hypothetical protein